VFYQNALLAAQARGGEAVASRIERLEQKRAE
jgi:hypothetical protein